MDDAPEVRDVNGELIEIGSKVKYLNTGTLGKVAEIIAGDDGTWVLLDTTRLYYKPETLILTTEEAVKERKLETSVEMTKDYLREMAEEAAARDLNEVSQFTGGG